jgi:C-terminal processing protease CtpA/Prc
MSNRNEGQKLSRRTAARGALLAIALTGLAACGSGGGGGDTPMSPPTGWQQGVFLNSATFASQCQAPRSGTNPATNAPYPDVQGSVLDENNFLRSYSNETYLWYSEIVDQNPALFSNPIVYFDELKTDAITASGADKDKYHYTYDTYEYYLLSQSGVSAGYGVQWALLSPTPPREVRVAYTEQNTPATIVNLARGATLLSVDGIDVVNDNTQAGVNIINEALFYPEVGSTHTFSILDLGAGTPRTVSMTAAEITSDPVPNVRVFDTSTGRVGYMLFNDHIITAEGGLIDAVNQLNQGAGIDDLVLDIRYNGGGYLFIASQLAYMIAGNAQTAGRTFELTQFNDKHPSTNPVTGEAIGPTPFYNVTSGYDVRPPNQALPSLNLSRVYVLTGGSTCSASESIMNALRGIDVEVIQIGSTTCGKPYGFYPTDNCGTTYFTIQFRGVNEKNFGDYTDGFSPANHPIQATTVPGCSVADDFSSALGDVNEERVAAALVYRDFQTCPAPSGAVATGMSKTGMPYAPGDGIVPKPPTLTNRIMERWPL